MTPQELANKSSYTVGRIRQLVRDGTIKAKKKSIPGGGFAYEISAREVQKFLRRERYKHSN